MGREQLQGMELLVHGDENGPHIVRMLDSLKSIEILWECVSILIPGVGLNGAAPDSSRGVILLATDSLQL